MGVNFRVSVREQAINKQMSPDPRKKGPVPLKVESRGNAKGLSQSSGHSRRQEAKANGGSPCPLSRESNKQVIDPSSQGLRLRNGATDQLLDAKTYGSQEVVGTRLTVLTLVLAFIMPLPRKPKCAREMKQCIHMRLSEQLSSAHYQYSPESSRGGKA